MSTIIPAQAVWGPPEFPPKGRLKLSRQQLEANYKLRKKEENRFKSQSNMQQQVTAGTACCKTLHMSFFFDGTNNHRDSDIKVNNLTNIARLFEATYDDESQKEKKQREYFKYYMPGVGAPLCTKASDSPLNSANKPLGYLTHLKSAPSINSIG